MSFFYLVNLKLVSRRICISNCKKPAGARRVNWSEIVTSIDLLKCCWNLTNLFGGKRAVK